MFGSPRSVLHPEDAPEVLVDFPRPMTLGAAHEQLSHIRLLYSAKHELVTLATAAGAGFAMHISANRADFPLSLEHRLFSRTIGPRLCTHLRKGTAHLKIPKR